ncbi:hypothetical protein BKA62DRAFT_232294 [Auriculariales sp. MPI-PUGE-AT-0066]|nr:hypothetical protein BKA62DRAFT_232294 [Auriculariales sp. MPI-PUGE-AT-0066]
MNSPGNPDSPISTSSDLSDGEELAHAPAAGGSAARAPSRRLAAQTPTQTGKALRRPERSNTADRDRERVLRAAAAEGSRGAGKEELVDVVVAEIFKKDIGDPFDDTILKSAA